MQARGHSFMGCLGLLERENPVDDGPDAAGVYQGPYLGPERVANAPLFRARTGAQHCRREGETLHHHGPEIHFGGHALLERDIDEATAVRKGAEIPLDIISADHVENDIDSAPTRTLLDGAHEVLAAVVDRALRSQFLACRAFFRTACRYEDRVTERRAELNRRGADAAGAAMD